MSPSSPADSPRDVGVLIAAGGVGERAGGGTPKQFRSIAGVPMLLRAIRPFTRHPRVLQVVVALPPAYATDPPAWLAEVAGSGLRLVAGGVTRAASVRAALDAVASDCRIILVHDAARPFVGAETVDAVIATASRGIGAVPAIPVSDTLKRTDAGSARVIETVARQALWRAQTPQGFPRAMLNDAYARAERGGEAVAASDDAALVEAAGYPVELVPDTTTNLKITTAEDFVLGDALAAR